MAKNVKCIDCGFLALRDVQTRELVETELHIRDAWKLPPLFGMQNPRYEIIPICFARAARLDQEIGKTQATGVQASGSVVI